MTVVFFQCATPITQTPYMIELNYWRQPEMRRKWHLLTSFVDCIRSISGQLFLPTLRRIGIAAATASATLILSGCVESEKALLTDAKPLLGQQFEVHLYESFVDKKANSFHSSVYHWKDGQYVRESGLARDVRRFVAQPLSSNDFLIQATGDTEKQISGGNDNLFEYWIGRRVIEGVYLIFALNEADVDDATRSAVCGKEKPEGICHIQSYDQLVILARATAAKPVRESALGVVLAK